MFAGPPSPHFTTSADFALRADCGSKIGGAQACGPVVFCTGSHAEEKDEIQRTLRKARRARRTLSGDALCDAVGEAFDEGAEEDEAVGGAERGFDGALGV